MTDVRADDLDEGDRLPWLEAVDEDEGGEGPSALKLIVAVLIGLAAIGGIVGGLFWLGNRNAGTSAPGEVATVKAPEGPYKVRPENPGGMTVQGQGDSSFAASAGADPKGKIDANKVPEAPVTATHPAAPAAQPAQPQAAHPAQPAQTQVAQAKPQPQAPKPATPAKPAPAPAAAAGLGGSIQLGAFPSQASAEKAWKAMSGRFGYLAPLSHNVVQAQVNGKTWYRLRASGAGASGVCGRLRVAGENCFPID